MQKDTDVVIIGAARTAIGRFGGALALFFDVHHILFFTS